ncbi:MAG: UDP-N-acetylmuramoyl-tripeptide--D-alanyl-D-alanine ligase [Clostridiaceae bacterium]|nr:UDP-N-acetylmuramoyl-tripeptide--D-alanyl-D-alanine ligase [Clostridiaceae bacterium]
MRDIAAWCGAEADGTLPDVMVTEVSRNTKTLRRGALFVPLRGACADGHDYIDKAAEAGAAAALCDRRDVTARIPLLQVENTLSAAQVMAARYRERFTTPVIGVTGSAGKTTTVAMIAAVLRKKNRLITTPAEDNGQIGLTFGVFNLEHTHDAAVWEMGMSQYGELSRLSRMTRPDIGVINGIGNAHIEFFGSRENILKAKLELLDGMREGAKLILNGDDDLLWGLRGKLSYNVTYYGLTNPDADIRGEVIYADTAFQTLRIRFGDGTVERVLPAIGAHNARNALAAVAVGRAMGMTADEIAFEGFESVSGRQNIVKKYGLTVMEDWYNASPEAVCASLDVLATLAGENGRRYACLGCMRELGESSAALHRLCGETAARDADFLYVYGEGAEGYLEGAKDAGMSEDAMAMFSTHEELARALYTRIRPGDAALFKGSHHFTHMELCMARFYALMEEYQKK